MRDWVQNNINNGLGVYHKVTEIRRGIFHSFIDWRFDHAEFFLDRTQEQLDNLDGRVIQYIDSLPLYELHAYKATINMDWLPVLSFIAGG